MILFLLFQQLCIHRTAVCPRCIQYRHTWALTRQHTEEEEVCPLLLVVVVVVVHPWTLPTILVYRLDPEEGPVVRVTILTATGRLRPLLTGTIIKRTTTTNNNNQWDLPLLQAAAAATTNNNKTQPRAPPTITLPPARPRITRWRHNRADSNLATTTTTNSNSKHQWTAQIPLS